MSTRRRARTGNVRMMDVARSAGVSTATVSRVLNSPSLVPPDTQARVLAAMARTGFVRNAIAGSLAARRSRTVAVVIPSISNAIFAESTHGVVDVLEAKGYSVFIGSTNYILDRETKLIRTFLERQVDGLVLTGTTHEAEAERMLRASRRPFVTTWEFDRRHGHATVAFDNEAAGREMTEALINLGHSRIGMVSIPMRNNDRATGRVRGYRAALATHGIAADPTLVLEVPPGFEGGRRAMSELLAHQDPPTAVFFGNDVLAVGALLECATRDVVVPAQVSIAGFDDLDLARHIQPTLTTVRVPTYRMGTLAAEVLLGMIDGGRARKHRLDVEIVHRASTGPPSKD